jgi:hypothetical protein
MSNVPRQGARQRVFVLMTFLRDDNGDTVELSDKILAGTTSEKVGREVLETFKKHRNGHATMIHEQNENQYLPGFVGEIMAEKMPEPPKEPVDAGLDALLSLVELP